MKLKLLFVGQMLTMLLGAYAGGQNVVADWNTVASTTIVKNGGKPSGAASVWFAYSAIAVYDAINAITHKFQPFYYAGPGPDDASTEAAAIAASHRVLVHYFPAQEIVLDADFNASMAGIQASSSAKTAGVAVGEASAAALISARRDDGLEADIPYEPGTAPGIWQPTPPKFMAAATPWLGQMRPFTMKSPSQFPPEGPTPLDSERWERDYELTRILGQVNSTVRTPSQTESGIFWTEHTPQQYARAFLYLASNYKLNILDTARLFAILWTGAADASIGCFNAKYHYSFWRPVTAIPAGGGSPKLVADPSWVPLATTPNHPEYPAQHGCISNAIAHLIKGFFGTPKVSVTVDSMAFSDGIHTHHFDDTRALFAEVFWARIYAGFHFQHSLLDGARLGKRVADQLLREHFRAVCEPDRDCDREDE